MAEYQPTYRQSPADDGMIIFEAEDYHHNEVKEQSAWREVHEPYGLSRGAGMQALSDIDATFEEDLDTSSPRLDYRIDFAKTGPHYLWIRAYGKEKGHICHAGLDGNPPAADQTIPAFKNRYSWENARIGGPTPINVPDKGIHTLNIWMREDGLVIDKILITSNPEFRP